MVKKNEKKEDNESFDKAMKDMINISNQMAVYSETIWNLLSNLRHKNSDRKTIRIKAATARSFIVRPGIISFLNSEADIQIEIDWDEMEALGTEMVAKAKEKKLLLNREKV